MALRKYWTRSAGGSATGLNLFTMPLVIELNTQFAGNVGDTLLDVILEVSFAINTPDTSTAPTVAWWNAQTFYVGAYIWSGTGTNPLLAPDDSAESIVITGQANPGMPVRYSSVASGSVASWTQTWTSVYPLRSAGMRKAPDPASIPAVTATAQLQTDNNAFVPHASQYQYWFNSFMRCLWGTQP